MSPITHLLASWTLADVARRRGRDLALVAWCGVLPDLDGLGVVLDLGNRLLGRPETFYFGEFHHSLLHGLPAALLLPLVLLPFAVSRLHFFVAAVAAVHLHLLCDLVGSRGPGIEDRWPIPYLAPFSERLTFEWSGQWPLNGWPNIAITFALIGWGFWRAIQRGDSPVGVFSTRADRAFVAAVRARVRAWRGGPSS